jgi:hypothetical protein
VKPLAILVLRDPAMATRRETATRRTADPGRGSGSGAVELADDYPGKPFDHAPTTNTAAPPNRLVVVASWAWAGLGAGSSSSSSRSRGRGLGCRTQVTLNTRRFAQAALIPEELLEREHINTAHAAAILAIPADELADALAAANASRDTSPANAYV